MITLDSKSKPALVALLYTAAMLTILEYLFFPPRIESWLHGGSIYEFRAASLQAGTIWALACFTSFLLIPVGIVKLWHRAPLASIGFSASGFVRHLGVYLGLFALMIPVIYAAATMPAFQNAYPFIYEAKSSLRNFLLWELAYVLQFVALEAFFRGYLLFTLEKSIGAVLAIAVMVMPYTMIHFHKPLPECLGAIVAGLFLGYLSLKYRSWAGGAMVHALVAITMDGLAAHRSGLF